jgi:hypothetical protein
LQNYLKTLELLKYRDVLKNIENSTTLAHDFTGLGVDYYMKEWKYEYNNIVKSWFLERQICLLKVGMDLIWLMVLNAVFSLLNFFFIKSDIMTFASLIILGFTVLLQISLYYISQKSDKWEKNLLAKTTGEKNISLESLIKVPVRVLVAEEEIYKESDHLVNYYKFIKNSLQPLELESYNTLKNEYLGSVKELVQVVKNL